MRLGSLKEIMKAAIVEKPGKLVVKELPMPEIGDYQMLCKLLFGATCSGTDAHLIDNTFTWPQKYPILLGHESVGKVIETGKRVKNFKIGDLVTRVGTPCPPGMDFNVFGGGFAEFGVAGDYVAMRKDGLPGEQWQKYMVNLKIPAKIPPEKAPMIITWRETNSYFMRMGVAGADSLLIIGSGANAFSFAAMARALKVKKTVMIGSSGRMKDAAKFGVRDYFDYNSENLPEQLKMARIGGFAYAIDAVGRSQTANLALSLLKPEGCLGIYGIDDYVNIGLNPSAAKGPFRFFPMSYNENEAHDRVVKLILNGALEAADFIDLKHPYKLAEIGNAFEAVKKRKTIKALVKLS